MFAVSLLAALALSVPHAATVGAPWQATLRAAAQPTIVATGPSTLRARGVRQGTAWRVTLRFPSAGAWHLRAIVRGKAVQLGTVTVDIARDPLLVDPIALAVDRSGALFVGQLRQAPLLRLDGGRATRVADGPGGFFQLSAAPSGLYGAGRDGAVYRWDGHALTRVTPPVDAGSVAVDAAGNVYVTNYEAGTVRRIAPDGTIRVVASGLFHPHALAIGSGHDLYIADTENRRIRRLDMATLELTTFGGDVGITVSLAVAPDGSVYSADVVRNGAGGGVTRTTPEGTTARVLSNPTISAVAVDGGGTVYVNRYDDRRIDRLVDGRLEPVARG